MSFITGELSLPTDLRVGVYSVDIDSLLPGFEDPIPYHKEFSSVLIITNLNITNVEPKIFYLDGQSINSYEIRTFTSITGNNSFIVDASIAVYLSYNGTVYFDSYGYPTIVSEHALENALIDIRNFIFPGEWTLSLRQYIAGVSETVIYDIPIVLAPLHAPIISSYEKTNDLSENVTVSFTITGENFLPEMEIWIESEDKDIIVIARDIDIPDKNNATCTFYMTIYDVNQSYILYMKTGKDSYALTSDGVIIQTVESV